MGIVSRLLHRSPKHQSRVFFCDEDVNVEQESACSSNNNRALRILLCSMNIKPTTLFSTAVDDVQDMKHRIDDIVKLMDACSALSDILGDLQQYARAAQRALTTCSRTAAGTCKWNRATMLRTRNALGRLPTPADIFMQSTARSCSSPSKSPNSRLTRSGSMHKKFMHLIQRHLPLDLESLQLSINKIASALDAALTSGSEDLDILTVDAASASAQQLDASVHTLQLHADSLFRSLRDTRMALNSL